MIHPLLNTESRCRTCSAEALPEARPIARDLALAPPATPPPGGYSLSNRPQNFQDLILWAMTIILQNQQDEVKRQVDDLVQIQQGGSGNLETATIHLKRAQDRYTQLFEMFKNILEELASLVKKANQWQ